VSIRWDDGFWNYDDPPYFSYHAVPVGNRVATSTTSTLEFLFFMDRDDFLFDEISVQAVGGMTTAPEPATVAMLAVGLGVLALSRLSARRSSGQRLG
jgi:hypothetical protein